MFVLAKDDAELAAATPLRFVLEREDETRKPIVRKTRFLAPGNGHGGS